MMSISKLSIPTSAILTIILSGVCWWQMDGHPQADLLSCLATAKFSQLHFNSFTHIVSGNFRTQTAILPISILQSPSDHPHAGQPPPSPPRKRCPSTWEAATSSYSAPWSIAGDLQRLIMLVNMNTNLLASMIHHSRDGVLGLNMLTANKDG